ncbi:MAG: hypothetical protein HY518_04305, partial [Candidatus Aenigmarchaeota archaeon]|nr:hypothetical protein [Candidatus Aenigmarchaeota archaeon]
MRLYWMAFTAIFAATLLALTGAASASITVDIMDSRGFYGPGQGLEGGLIFTHDQPVPANSFVHASIDSGPVISSQNASAYAGNSTNVFAQQPFGYNVTLSGTSSWNETPNQTFDYKYRVSYVDKDGLPVSQEFGKSKGTVSQTEGVKFIDDATEFVLPENSTNVAYQEIANVNPKVLTTMRMACAGQEYGIDRDDVKLNGWIFKTLRVDLFPPEPGSNNRSANIEAFDNKSLDRGFTMFGGPGVPFPHGGIYKGLVYQEYGKDAIWNGTDGFIKIIDFDDNALYEMAFLPPNGPSLCAYTGFTIPNSTQWIGFLPDSGSVRFGETFSRDYRKDTLIGQLASACPSRSRTCDIAADSFGAIKTSDAAGGVQLSYDDTDASIFTVSAATTLPVSTTNRTFSIGFADFLSLNAPSSRGIHLLTFTLKSGSSTLASSTTNFTVCLDNDGDGY